MHRIPLTIALLASAGTAQAGEIFGGRLADSLRTPVERLGYREGMNTQFGWRGDRITALKAIGSPAPYAFTSVNNRGNTNFAAAGLSWRIGGRLYARPGIGIAVHDRSSRKVRPDGYRGDLGSRVLFEPELSVGFKLNQRTSLEASWVHLSHAFLAGPQNPGMDIVGIRYNVSL
jgi:lipid A 3-O-deacylase